MKVTNRKLYSASGFSLDPANDLLPLDGDDYDDEEELDDMEEDEDETEEDDDGDVVTRRFGMGVLQKSLFGQSSSSNDEKVHLNNNPSSPTTETRFPQPPSKQHQQLLDGNSHEAVPLPGPPRDLIAQIVRPRFVTLSWMEPHKNPDEVVSYDVFYKMNTSER